MMNVGEQQWFPEVNRHFVFVVFLSGNIFQLITECIYYPILSSDRDNRHEIRYWGSRLPKCRDQYYNGDSLKIIFITIEINSVTRW